MAFGDYPAEYIPEKHGPYDPARYYGKREYKSFKKIPKNVIKSIKRVEFYLY